MKKVMMTAMLMLAMTATMAQNERPAKMDATSLTELLVKQLGLSSTQKTKVSALNKKYESVLGGPEWEDRDMTKTVTAATLAITSVVNAQS